MAIIVTGGAGFIGSALVRHLINTTDETIVNVDALTYAGDLFTLNEVAASPRYVFQHADISDRAAMDHVFAEYEPTVVFNLAAESHVDRSIDDPSPFLTTNVVGTFTLLEAARAFWGRRDDVRFLHVSTDEVFGSLGPLGAFTESTPYDPSSPYSATKAASDHLVRAWHRTYGLPVLITNCSNNYGPYQFPEKLIPLMILKGLSSESMPVYGRGDQVRDWLYVDDHVKALTTVLAKGQPGETYNIGGHNERANIEVVETICAILDQEIPTVRHRELISFVSDRPGHDARYAIDNTRITGELGWRPEESFESGLARTVRWVIDHQDWYRSMSYAGERLGTASGSES